MDAPRAARPFVLGINYPWRTCGHDFGPRPPPWAGAARTDWGEVEAELAALRALGLTAARWWILAGGVNLPVGASIEPFADRRPWLSPWPRWRRPFVARRPGAAEHHAPRRALPKLPRAFLDDFDALLAACERTGVRLVPSLVSFEMFLPLRQQGAVTSQGRADLLLGEQQRAFFDGHLEPLLEVSEARRDAILAWEVANEPGWATRPGGLTAPGGPHPAWVSPDAMGRFLIDGARRIAARGFLSTVGFVRADVPWLPPSDRTALWRLAARGAYVHQLHHYPRPRESPTLPPVEASPIRPCWVGEMATSTALRWRDRGLAEDDPSRYLEARIRHVERMGYDGALLWARRAEDPQTRWDEGVRAQVARVSAAW